MTQETNQSVKLIASLIHGHRIDLSSEKRVQEAIEGILTTAGIEFEREKKLSVTDIPDFVVENIVIECKVRGARKMDVYRQLCRYAEHDSVHVLMLVSNISMGMPPEINGKPVYCVSLSRGWM